MQKLVVLLVVVAVLNSCNQPKTETAAAPAPVELGDSTKADLAKASYMALIAGDVDGFAASMSDDAVFCWNSSDSLVGKTAILEYWKDRRENVIDTLEIRNDVWMPLRINKFPNANSGEYVMMWAWLTSTYQFGGKPMVQRFYQVYRFNSEGKINHITHYIDRYAISESLPPPPRKK